MISMPASISTAGIAEDFKLASGTGSVSARLRRVSSAPARRWCANVVIAGLNRDHISALVVLDLDGCRLINPGVAVTDIAAAANDPLVRAAFRERFTRFFRQRHPAREPHHRAGVARQPAVDRPRRGH